jgi:hypothetical protein
LEYRTFDSGDGITNPELRLSCALESPNVFFDTSEMDDPAKEAADLCDSLYQSLLDKGVQFDTGDPDGPFLGFSYSAPDRAVTIFLFNVSDETIWGPDPGIAKKRLDFQIRYCDHWIANPPVDKMLEDGQSQEDIEEAKIEYAALREGFATQLKALQS